MFGVVGPPERQRCDRRCHRAVVRDELPVVHRQRRQEAPERPHHPRARPGIDSLDFSGVHRHALGSDNVF